VNPVPEHDGAVEREAGLRTAPGDELANRVVVGSLATGGCQAIQDGCLGVFEVRERQNPLGGSSCEISTWTSATAAFTVADSFITGSSCGVTRYQSTTPWLDPLAA
jgi:hypothetical protein